MSISAETLTALRNIRDAVPKLCAKLEQSSESSNDQSGLISEHDVNEWGIPISMPSTAAVLTPATAPAFPETYPSYWQSVAEFDENGKLISLLLGGQRLRSLKVESLLPSELMETVSKLDLAGTDISATDLCHVLQRCQRLTSLYLGGNSFGDAGIVEFSSALPQSLRVLDLRYNDIVDSSTAALAEFIHHSSCEKLYLEGNKIGDSGVGDLSKTGPIKELFLGQNNIGPQGAESLAQGLSRAESQLEKLYLEGNHIGPAGAISFRSILENPDNKTKLKNLFVDNNQIGKEESIALGRALSSNTMIGDSAC